MLRYLKAKMIETMEVESDIGRFPHLMQDGTSVIGIYTDMIGERAALHVERYNVALVLNAPIVSQWA
jgi:hypothetical protein